MGRLCTTPSWKPGTYYRGTQVRSITLTQFCIDTFLFTLRDNPKYRANVNHLADLYLASRQPPLDDAAWLMEFVATTRGAEHLKVASRHLSLIQLCNLDVLLFAIIVAILVLKLVVKVALICKRRLHQSKEITEGNRLKKRQ